MQPLITVTQLADRLHAGQRTVLLDVRWALGDPLGHEHYLASHLPGAGFVDLATELADASVQGRGRHPLPSVPAFQAAARRWGVNTGDTVVAYDDSGNMAAARLWWMLRNAGVDSVVMLDGGLSAWRDAGHPLVAGPVVVTPGTVELSSGGMPTLDSSDASGWSADGVLLDARAGERYRGEHEPVDPRAGHIPGAVSAPTSGNLDTTGHFLPAEQLRARFEALGVRDGAPLGVYCGSGVTAAHQVAALEIAGFSAALYPGSFSEWSNRPELPVATGSEPDGGHTEPATLSGIDAGHEGSVKP